MSDEQVDERAIARWSVGWDQSGDGYQTEEQAKKEWEDCPGTDWTEGVPSWARDDFDDPSGFGLFYRTVLVEEACGLVEDPPGYSRCKAYSVNPEPEMPLAAAKAWCGGDEDNISMLCDDDGNHNNCATIYIGEGWNQVVYCWKPAVYAGQDMNQATGNERS